MLTSIVPKRGTPTADIRNDSGGRGRRDEIDGIEVWIKGNSPTSGSSIHSPYRERAAYVLDCLLGFNLVPPTILHLIDNELVSAQTWVTGERPDGEKEPIELEIFDYIIGNCDRHEGNWIIGEDGEIWAIDNAFAFYSCIVHKPDYDAAIPETIKDNLREALKYPQEIDKALDRLISKEVIDAIISRMETIVDYGEEEAE